MGTWIRSVGIDTLTNEWVSNESIRRWVLKFWPVIARNLRGTRPKPHSRWHLDEMVVSIAGRQMYMWRAVDNEGEVLEILVQPQRDKAAAVRLLRTLLRRQGFVPAVIITDKLRSAERHFAKLASRVCMSKDCAPTIARRIRTSRFDDANEKCKASNQSNQLSSLFPSTRPFTTRSTCNGI